MQSELKKTKNYFRCIGTVSEIKLERENCEVKLWKDGKADGSVDGERIRGRISVDTGKNGVHTFDVYNQIRGDAQEYYESLTDDNEKKSFKRQMDYFHMFEEMMNWTPAIGKNADPDNPTLVNIEGTVAINDYVNQQGEVSSSLRWNVRSGNTKASPDDPRGTTLSATLIITKIAHEIKDEEETGRLIVTGYGANKKGACFPVTAFVPVEVKTSEGETLQLADVFEDCYETGMTVPLEFELSSHHVGGANRGGKKKFGKSGDVAVNEGFNVTELLLVGGDDEIEEPEELTREDENGNEVEVKTEWIDPQTMRMAIKERAKMLEELKNNPPKSKSNDVKTGLQNAKKQAAKDKMKSGMKSKSASFDDMDSDDDFPF